MMETSSPMWVETRCQLWASEGGAVIYLHLRPETPSPSTKGFTVSKEEVQPSPAAAHRLGQS